MHDLTLTPRVRERIRAVRSHILDMRIERAGWGDTANREVAETALSFLDGLDILIAAEEVWIDGGTGLSFGGRLPGGIIFGLIARETPRLTMHKFDVPAMNWTVHS